MARPRKGVLSKAQLIRTGLAEHPDHDRSELAALLNEQVRTQGLDLPEITPADISVYRSKLHKDALTPTPTTPPSPDPALTAAGIAELVKAARLLLDRLGRDEAKRLLDAL